MLAEPNLTAVSGETAKFLAGGEFPVPVGRDQQGNVTIEFKQFGVGLSFTPVVLSPQPHLAAALHRSQRTHQHRRLHPAGGTTTRRRVTTCGAQFTIPALVVRRAETTVELPSGGSFAIAGLMQHNTKQVIDGFPGPEGHAGAGRAVPQPRLRE